MQNIQNDQRHVCEHTCKSSQKKIQNYKFKGSFFDLVFNIIIKSVNYSVKFFKSVNEESETGITHKII